MEAKLEKLFHFSQKNTTLRTELLAGLTTFMGMSYILAVNPDVLSATGMDKGAVFTATALAAALGTLFMALLTNYPFALAPGMGLNAYFAYTVCIKMGYDWETALTAVFIEGLIFVLLSITNVREALFNAIPSNLKTAITAGIGFYIAVIGMENAHLIVASSSTLITMYSWKGQSSFSMGLTVILAVVGILLIGFFMIRKVKGAVLWGILMTWLIGIVCQLTGLYVPDPAFGLTSLIPDFSRGITISSIAPIAMKMDFTHIFSFDFLVVIFAFLFVDVFDTLGTLMGCGIKAGFVDADGRLPKVRGALLADALATTAGAMLGTSTITTCLESSLGVSEGGRTGLTSLTVAVLFLLSLLLSPIFLAIPSFATAPALIMVGFMMMQTVKNLELDDLTEGIPAFLAMIGMPLLYSVAEGIGAGVISYVVLNIATGKKEKVNVVMIVIALLFICKYIFL